MYSLPIELLVQILIYKEDNLMLILPWLTPIPDTKIYYGGDADSIKSIAKGPKRSVGVAPEVNMRNQLYADNEKHPSEKFTLARQPRADVTRSPKTGLLVTPPPPPPQRKD